MTRHVELILTAAILLLVTIEWLWAAHHHPVFPWHHWPGFLAALGFIACVVVVKVSKWLGKTCLQCPEEIDE